MNIKEKQQKMSVKIKNNHQKKKKGDFKQLNRKNQLCLTQTFIHRTSFSLRIRNQGAMPLQSRNLEHNSKN